MYNEFAPKHYKGKWPCTTKTLYNEKTLTGRLHKYFLIYFKTFSAPTADTLFLLVLSILTLESVHSIRFLYQHFLSGITTKSLNTFYHACSYAKVDYSHFMNITSKVALRMFQNSSRIWILSAMPGLILSCMILLLHIPAAEDVPPNMGRDFLLKQIFLIQSIFYWDIQERAGEYYRQLLWGSKGNAYYVLLSVRWVSYVPITGI